MKKIRNSQLAIPVLNRVKHQSFPVSIVNDFLTKTRQFVKTLCKDIFLSTFIALNVTWVSHLKER